MTAQNAGSVDDFIWSEFAGGLLFGALIVLICIIVGLYFFGCHAVFADLCTRCI